METSTTKSHPSRMTDGQYAVLQETSAKYEETWIYFIRVDGNEENLKSLQDQLEQISSMRLYDDLNTFDLESEHYVSATTAKEMSLVDLNYKYPHRKFDGKLNPIQFKFKSSDKNKAKIRKVNDLLKNGRISNFIDDEDIDSDDLLSNSETMSESESESDTESDTDSEPEQAPPMKNSTKLPSSLKPKSALKKQMKNRG